MRAQRLERRIELTCVLCDDSQLTGHLAVVHVGIECGVEPLAAALFVAFGVQQLGHSVAQLAELGRAPLTQRAHRALDQRTGLGRATGRDMRIDDREHGGQVVGFDLQSAS